MYLKQYSGYNNLSRYKILIKLKYMHLLFLEGIFVSLGENKALKLIDNDRDGVIKLNQHMLVRTYPAGSRTDSSNYNPVPMWNAGCQVGEYQVVISQILFFGFS